MEYTESTHSTAILLLAIALSFIVASSLSVYPLSSTIAMLRPMVIVMVLIFWLLFQPRFVGIVSAFFIGVIADLLLDTRLGQQAFAAVIVALVVKSSSIYFKRLTIASAWFIATLALLAFQLSFWLLQLLMQNPFVLQSGLSLAISIISWPLVLLVLSRFTP